MNRSNFLKGMGIGMALGSAAGRMMPRRRRRKHAAAKAARSLSAVVDNLSKAMEW